MAIEMVKHSKNVTLINPTKIDEVDTSDPSKVLSPYTLNKFIKIKNSPNLSEVIGIVESINKDGNYFSIQIQDKTIFKSNHPPICATGFSLVHKTIEKLLTF